MTDTLNHARRELELAGMTGPESDYEGMIAEAVLELLEVFAKQGHSGGSAPRVAGLFKELALHRNLTPISGADHEWVDILDTMAGRPGYFQNNRASAVFKDKTDGRSYYLDAIVWRTQTGSMFSGPAQLADGTKLSSRQYIKSFPFTPKTFVVDVTERELEKDDWEFTVNDPEQLKSVFDYYEPMQLKA